jgi:hypothetical protein
MTDETSKPKHLPVPRDGQVVATTKPDVTEKEISDERDIIIQRLHAGYAVLQEAMEPFQQDWDANSAAALAEALYDGAKAGLSEWGSDFADYFKLETWKDLGGKIEKAAGTAYDTASKYAQTKTQEMIEAVNEVRREVDSAELANWAWWHEQAEEEFNRHYADAKARIASIEHEVKRHVEQATKIYRHRDAILNLPNQIAEGDVKGIEAFVDTVLMDIDPEQAKAIKANEDFYAILEVIADHESALIYLSYAGLCFEAIPPNFYAYMAGKGGAYLLVELVLLIVTALLSAGTAAAARIATLCTRIALSSAKIAKVARKAKAIQKAVESFLSLMDDFSRAVDDLYRLGQKLVKARSRGVVLKGPTKTTLRAKRELIKRDKKCRICGSTQHTTPHHRLGTVEYE